MPKKWVGENSKAAVARARKEATRQEELQKKKQKEEDAFWEDDDKNVQRKQQRKEDREKKRVEQLEKKTQTKAMLEEEMACIDSRPTSAAKLTRAQIQVCHAVYRPDMGIHRGMDVPDPLLLVIGNARGTEEEGRRVQKSRHPLGYPHRRELE